MNSTRRLIGIAVFFFATWLCSQAGGAVYVTTNILVDQTWTTTNSPYYICYWDCTVLSNVTLTIEPGVTVILGKGQDIGGGFYLSEELKVQGTLIADGATFTSTNAVPATWSRLDFLNGSVGRLTNYVIQYGGFGVVTYGLVHVSGTTDLEFIGCTFQYGEYEGDSGVYINYDATGTARFVNCLFTNLNIGITGARDSGADIEVDGCTFDNLHAYGLYLCNNSAQIRNSVFRNILSEDVVLLESYDWWCKTAHLAGNQFDGGGKAVFPVVMDGAVNFSATNNTLTGYSATNNGVQVAGSVPKGWTSTWARSDMAYTLRETVDINGDASSRGSLTIHGPNTVRYYPNASLRTWGDLTIAGAPDEPVRLTTALNAAGGNGILVPDGLGQVWIRHAVFDTLAAGLHIAWASSATARVDIAHSTFSNITATAIKMENGAGCQELTVSNSLVTACGSSFYNSSGGMAVFSNVTFRNTGRLYFSDAASRADFRNCNFHRIGAISGYPPIYGNGSAVSFQHCTIVGNDGTGVELTGGTLTDCIIWGHREQAIGGYATTASYCCIEGGYTGPGSNNLSVSPGFIG